MEEIQVSIIALYIIFFASTSFNTRLCATQEEEKRHLLSSLQKRQTAFYLLGNILCDTSIAGSENCCKSIDGKMPQKTLSSRQRWNGNKFFLSFFISIISEPEENSRDVVILGARAVISPSPVNRQTNSTNFSFSELLMVAFKIIFLLYLHETMILI